MTYHISHTDLDGYGCQMVTKKALPNDIVYYNTGYGKRIDEDLDVVLSILTPEDTLLITDLNLTEEQSKKVDDAAREVKFSIILLDHHETGKPSADKYPWYHLDTTRCATKIIYDWFVDKGIDLTDIKYTVDMINIYDLWQENNPLFSKAKGLNQVLWNNKGEYPKVLGSLENHFLIYMIDMFGKSLKAGHSIPRVELMAYEFKRTFFDPDKMSEDPLHIAKIRSMYPYIMDSDLFTSVEIDGKQGKVFFGLDSIFQEFSSMLLHESEIDFAVNIGTQGNLSLRSRNGTRVNDIARQYFHGGGHPAAAGGSLLSRNEKEQKFEKDSAFKKFFEKIS